MSQKFLKFTSESLSASYIPFPRFLMEDSLAGLSNDAKVLYALMLVGRAFQKSTVFLKLTIPSGFTLPWNRRRSNCTAADNVRRGFSMSLSLAV